VSKAGPKEPSGPAQAGTAGMSAADKASPVREGRSNNGH
jgi:hypothetical protein